MPLLFYIISCMAISALATNKYQTGISSPCESVACIGLGQIGNEGSLTYNVKFTETFPHIPYVQVYIVSYKNLNVKGSYFELHQNQISLVNFWYKFSFRNGLKYFWFKVGWVATTLDNIQLMSSGQLNDKLNSTLQFQKHMLDPKIMYYLKYAQDASATFSIEQLTQQSLMIIPDISTKFELIFVLVEASNNNEEQLQDLTYVFHTFRLGQTNDLTLNLKGLLTNISYGVSSYSSQYQTAPVSYWLSISQDKLNIDYQDFPNLTYIEIGYFTFRLVYNCSEGCLSCSDRDVCQECYPDWILYNNLCQCKWINQENATHNCSLVQQVQKLECHDSCLTCENIATNCTGCSSKYIFQNNSCTCQYGYYNFDLYMCQSCKDSCKRCTSEDKCSECFENFQMQNGSCVCAEGFYQVGDSCVECMAGTSLHNGSCLCDIGYLDPLTDQCVKCNFNCKQCLQTNSQCIGCHRNSSLVNESCVCDEGYFYHNQGCLLCKEHCNTTLDHSLFCQSCPKPPTTNVRKDIQSNQCSNCQSKSKKCKNIEFCKLCSQIPLNDCLMQLQKAKKYSQKSYTQKNQTSKNYTSSNESAEQMIIPSVIDQMSQQKKDIMYSMRNLTQSIGSDARYQIINIFMTITGYLANAQIIALLQFLDYTVPENVYYAESSLSGAIISKKFPPWQIQPKQISVSAQRVFINLFNNISAPTNLPQQFRRISFTQYFISNMGYGWMILLAIVISRYILNLDNVAYVSGVDFLFVNYVENTLTIIYVTLLLFCFYPVAPQSYLHLFDVLQLFLFLGLFIKNVISSYNKIARQESMNFLCREYFLVGLRNKPKQVKLVFINLCKKAIFMTIIVLLYKYTVLQLVMLMILQFIFTCYHLWLNAYRRRVLNCVNIVLDCLILSLISTKMHGYFYLQSIEPQMLLDDVIQYVEYGWIYLLIEMIFMIFVVLWQVVRFVLNQSDEGPQSCVSKLTSWVRGK